jgi:hypothetical protein
MFYEGYVTGDRIEVTPTYRSLMNPFLRSDIRDLNNPGADYKPKDPINGYVLNETLNGIWVMAEMPIYEDFKKTTKFTHERVFYEKDKYLFKNTSPRKMKDFLRSLV